MELKGTKTEKNLQEAFAGESQARNKYTYFASKARKEGYEQIADIFEETARNEKEHAKLWFKYLEGGDIKDTASNLEAAAAGENYEWTDMYDRMAKEADEEGFKGVTASFLATYKKKRYSPRTVMPSGSALTAATSLSARKLLRCAPFATIRRASSRLRLRTINQ